MPAAMQTTTRDSSLTAAADHFQQLVMAEFSQCLGRGHYLFLMASSSLSIHFNVFSRATVICFRPRYGGGG
jgi:hypothetical protein